MNSKIKSTDNPSVGPGITLNRRSFLKKASVFSAGLTVGAMDTLSNVKFDAASIKSKDQISLGIIGVGNRGRLLMALAAKHEGVQISAICDINPLAIQEAQKILSLDGHKNAKVYTGSEYAFQKLLKREDIDGVIIATTWDWHVPMAIEAMRSNKYVGLEVPAAMTVEDCWALVNTYEETKTNIMFLENCCYDRECMAVLKMIREGLFGIPIHATCGYRHSAWGNSKWLAPIDTETMSEHFVKYAALRNADQYPTHGIGPVANWLDINCGNRFLYLISVATKSQTINEYVKQHPQGGPNHDNAQYDFKQGDIVTTILKTERGETVVMNYDNYLPRPYSRDYSLQGTNGIWDSSFRSRGIYFMSKSPKQHEWERSERYDFFMQKYEHPLWKEHHENAKSAGHGGIDFFIIRDFIKCIKEDLYPPIDVYDAAVWSVIIPLSERSIESGSTPEYFPDFTRGKWRTREPYFGK